MSDAHDLQIIVDFLQDFLDKPTDKVTEKDLNMVEKTLAFIYTVVYPDSEINDEVLKKLCQKTLQRLDWFYF